MQSMAMSHKRNIEGAPENRTVRPVIRNQYASGGFTEKWEGA